MDNRVDTIFCKMLNYNATPLGCTDSPYTLTKQILQRGLIACQPPIMGPVSYTHLTLPTKA